MSAPASPPADDRWCDADGSHIALFCQVEQVAESSEPGMLPSRLHQQGQVVGRGLDSLYVCFEGNQVVSVSARLLRLLPDPPASADAHRSRPFSGWDATGTAPLPPDCHQDVIAIASRERVNWEL